PLSGVTNGAYAVPTNATTSTNTFYRVLLSVTDTNGYQQTAFQDVQPQIGQLTFVTVPAGLQITLDGQPLTTATSLPAVVGMARLAGAPSPQTLSGTNYQFVVWSDGGAQTHSLLVRPSNTTFTASFLQPSLDFSFAGANLQLAWPQWAAPMNL